jgi:hypothetical protein
VFDRIEKEGVTKDNNKWYYKEMVLLEISKNI